MSCGVGHRHSSEGIAVALIRPLAWEPRYIAGPAPPPQKKEILVRQPIMSLKSDFKNCSLLHLQISEWCMKK